MGKEEVGEKIRTKGLELKNFLKDLKAVLKEWKFSVEETKEGMLIEVHAIALVRERSKA
jgi:hypothetical protein